MYMFDPENRRELLWTIWDGLMFLVDLSLMADGILHGNPLLAVLSAIGVAYFGRELWRWYIWWTDDDDDDEGHRVPFQHYAWR